MSESQPPAGPPTPQGWGQQPPAPGWGQPAPPPGWGPPGPSYASYGWGGPPPAPKPGSVPLRPLGVGDILEATFSVLRHYLAATLGSAALVVAVVSTMQLLLLLPVVSELGPLLDATEQNDPALLVTELESISWAPLLAGGLLVGLLSAGLFVLLTGLMAVVVGQSAVGAPLSLPGAFRRALPRLPRLLGVSLLVVVLLGGVWVTVVGLWMLAVWIDVGIGYVAAVLLTLAAIPVTIYLVIKLSLATPAAALESTSAGFISPVTALQRSWRLVRGAWWRTLGLLVLAAIIAGALSQVVAIPASIVVSALPLSAGVALVTSVIVAGIGQAVSQPVSGLVLALVYVDRRIRTEQLDLALARAAGVDRAPEGGGPAQQQA